MQLSRSIQASDGVVDLTVDSHQLVERGVSNKDSADISSVFVLAWVVLLSDSPLHVAGSLKPKSTYKRFFNRLLRDPLVTSINHFADLSEQLMHCTSLFGEGSSTGPFLDGMKHTPIFSEYFHWWKTGDPKTLQYVLSFLRFGKKLEYMDESFYSEAFRSWKRVEEQICEVPPQEYVVGLSNIIKLLMVDIGPIPFLGKHGPGSTAGRYRGLVAKSDKLRYHPKLHRGFFSEGKYLRDKLAHDFHAVIPDDVAWASDSQHGLSEFDDTAWLEFVFKNTKTARSICMEPVSFMYFQQHVAAVLHKRIDSSLFSRFIRIRDQSQNQEYCHYGSFSGNVDTIDLSAASDSVSMSLVRAIFPKSLLLMMLSTRTSKVKLPDGSVVRIKKFAPMGSAVCFPTQCIIFLAVVLYAYILHAHESDGDCGASVLGDTGAIRDFILKRIGKIGVSSINPLTNNYEPPSVYGDDIICDSRVTNYVLLMLSRLGFIVNTDKSFLSSNAFRESCGKYYWNGHDVTPLLFRVKLFQKELGASSVASSIQACNNAGDYGYLFYRSHIINMLLYTPIRGIRTNGKRNPIRFTQERSEFGIFTTRSTRNTHLVSRVHTGYQRDEVRTIVLRAKEYKRPLSRRSKLNFDKQRYILWWRAAVLRGSDFEYDSKPVEADSIGARCVWGWTPDT